MYDGATVNPNPAPGAVWVYYGPTLGGGWSWEPYDTSMGVVTSFNGRNGAVELVLGDVTAAGGAPSTSPSLTGVPLSPTAPPGTSTNQIATCQFVQDAIVNVTGGITSVTAGTGLTGGGSSGDVTIALSIPVALAAGGTGATSAAVARTNLSAVYLGGDTMTGDLNIVPGDGSSARFDIAAGWSQLAVTGNPGESIVIGQGSSRDGYVWTNAASRHLILQSDGGDVIVTGPGDVDLARFSTAGNQMLVESRAITPGAGDSSTKIATTAFVQNALGTVSGGGASVTVADTPPPSPVQGDLWWDSTSAQLYIWYDDGTSSQWVIAVALPPPAISPYAVGFSYIGGTLTASQLIGLHKVTRASTIPANFANSVAGATANATGSTVIDVAQALAATPNTFSSIGSITIAAGSVTPTFATVGGSTKTLAVGDVIRLTGPVSPDATLANFYCTLVGQ